MLLVIIIIIVILLALLDKKGRHKSAQQVNETPAEQKRRETDELISVILPTIKNGK